MAVIRSSRVVQGVPNLVGYLRSRHAAAKRAGNPVAVVGYVAHYALYVHEDLSVAHRNGQAKFLEQPARMMQKELARTVEVMVKLGAPFDKAILYAAQRLKEESQKLVPVDTGFLRMSAFARLEESRQESPIRAETGQTG